MRLFARLPEQTASTRSGNSRRLIRVQFQHQSDVGHRQSQDGPTALHRRVVNTAFLGAMAMTLLPGQSAHAGFKKELKKRKVAEEEYVTLPDNGLRYYDLEEGSGTPVKPGDRVVVHYDCLYRGLDVVSSRSARLLGGNRTIAEPYEFVVGQPVVAPVLKPFDGDANPMFTGGAGPKPPQALSLAVVGMKRGGKRSVLVDAPALGYPQGVNELPPGAAFELKVDLLSMS